MKTKLLIIAICIVQLSLAQKYNYPPTPKIPVYDTIWGKLIQDDYRWMEDLNDPKVKKWFESQNEFAMSFLNRLSGVDELIGELKQFDTQQPEIYFYIAPIKNDLLLNYSNGINTFPYRYYLKTKIYENNIQNNYEKES